MNDWYFDPLAPIMEPGIKGVYVYDDLGIIQAIAADAETAKQIVDAVNASLKGRV